MKMRRLLSTLYIAVFTLVLLNAGQAFAEEVKPVENHYVCMVNDTIMDKTQIPVEVEGKTYYGCCMGCVQGLKSEAALRTAKDPVTGNPVDKATAVIGVGQGGAALYFESQETFNTFFKQGK